jgi:type IV pilus assembly protein PilA
LFPVKKGPLQKNFIFSQPSLSIKILKMTKSKQLIRQLGQGMTEYIIIVALIAIAAIGVYKAFGGMVRGQTSAASSALGGYATTEGKAAAQAAQDDGNNEAKKKKTMKDFQDN